jgi:hypothetical protein
MARKKTLPPIADNTLYYDYLNFFPPEAKNSLWLGQAIFYSKQNSVVFLDPKRKKIYRQLERGELNKQEYIDMIDPPTPMGGGGKAEYFSSSFQTCPVDIHIDNIVRARLDKICLQNKLQVNEIDKFALSQKQRDRQRIIYQREFRNLINDINQTIGLPKIKDSENLEEYIRSLDGEDAAKVTSGIDKTLDYIRSQIKDNQDLQLYDAYVYKGDVERAFEMGIQHYLIDLNKWPIIGEWFTDDYKHFNKYCGRSYTDETNGRHQVEYLEPDRLFTSPFKRNNGEDITMWHYEYSITFAEFVRQFGTTMTDEQLKEVFELNRYSGTRHGMSYSKAKSFKGSNTTIMVGIFSILTQDADSFSEDFTQNRLPIWQRKPPSWIPEENNKDGEGSKRQKIYNTWYSCYYIPPPGDRQARNQMTDWLWQSQYIFNIKKDIDMYRYGVDFRYAKSTLVIYKDDTRMSYTDIKEAFMPKIRSTWHKFENCLIQDTQALGIAKDFLGAVLKAVDETNKRDPGDPAYPTGGNGKDASVESMKMIKQGNLVFLDFRDSKTGEYVADPSKLFVPVDSGHIAKAERYIKLIIEQYNLMQMSLSQNSMTEGQSGKSHVPEAGIQATLAASSDGMWFMEKPIRELQIMFGQRTIQWLITVVKEHKKYGYSDRWNEIQNVIGLANSWLLESIEELDPETIGMTVSLEDVSFYEKYLFELANKMADENQVSRDAVGLVINQSRINWKYAYCLLMIAAKKQQEEIVHKEQLQFEREKQMKQMDLQIAMALNKSKADGKNSNIQNQGRVDMAVNDALNKGKASTMADQKQQLLNNKLTQEDQKHQLQRGDETFQALSPEQK